MYEVEPGVVEFQFSHGASIPMATAYDLVGARGLFASSAVVGALALLAVFLALTTVTASPWLAVSGATALGVSLPMIYATRTTYSEPFVLVLITTAIAVLLADGRDLRRSQLALVGLLIGGSTLFRVDAQLYVVGLLALASVLMLRGSEILDVVIMLAAASVPAVVGTIDVRVFARDYVDGLDSNVAMLDRATLALGAVAVVVGVWTHRRRGTRRFVGGSAGAAVWAATVVAIVGVLAWQVRPPCGPPHRHGARTAGSPTRSSACRRSWGSRQIRAGRTASSVSSRSAGTSVRHSWHLPSPVSHSSRTV